MHVRAKKHLGQHFLKDEDIALRITEALTHHGGYRDVIEVGPGTGDCAATMTNWTRPNNNSSTVPPHDRL